MARDVALTSPELVLAAGAHTIKTFLLYVKSTAIATALINQSSFSYPLTQLTVDTTSGWSGVAAGMDVLIGTTAGASDVGIYRTWDTGNSTTLFLQEVASGDPGTVPTGIRYASFADDLFITVLNRYSMYSVLPVISGGTVFEDFNRSPGSENIHPAPSVSVKCSTANTAQYNHIATPVDAGQTYATVVFLTAATLWPTSLSATYAWTVPGSWTITAGAVNTATFTAQIPVAGQTNYVLKLTVTEDNGQIQVRYINVWVYDYATNIPIVISDYSGDGWDRTGAHCQFTLNDTLMSAIPDGAMVCIVQEATFGGSAILSAVTQFVGWLARADKRTEPGLRSADLEFISPAALMDKRRGTSQIWQAKASPATWQQVPFALCTLSFAQWWLMRNRAKGVLELFDFNIFSTAAGGQRLPQIEVSAASLWAQQVNLADGIQKRTIGCDPDGTFWVTQHPSLNDSNPRSGSLVVRDTLTASIYHDVDWPREYIPQVGLVEGEAFSWDGSAAQPTPLLALAPGFTPGQAVGDPKMQEQVVDSQATLNTLLGHYYASLNPDYGDITTNIQGNRGALLKPAQGQMVHEQIPTNLSPDGVAFDRYVIPREVRRSFVQAQDGSIVVDTSIVAEIETAGVAATTKPVPAANSNLYSSVAFISSVNLPPAISPSGYGQSSNFVPSRFWAISGTGSVYHGTGAIGSPVFVQKRPPGTNGLDYSRAGATWNAVSAATIFDPYSLNRLLIPGYTTIAVSDDASVTTPSWYYAWTAPAGIVMGVNNSGPNLCSMIASVTVRNTFFWTAINSGNNHVRVYRTTDNFASVSYVEIAANYCYCNALSITQYASSANSIIVYVSTSAGQYKSTDGGQTFSLWRVVSGNVGGALSVPYKLAGGASNTAGTNVYVGVFDGPPAGIAVDNGSKVNLATSDYLKAPQAINTFTIDGSIAATLSGGAFYRSVDSGVTWNVGTAQSIYMVGLNGWPTNPNFYVGIGGDLAYTTDAGLSWTDISAQLAAGGFGSSSEYYITQAFADLTEQYPVGGPH